MQYDVYEYAPFGTVRVAATIEAASDREALKQARGILPGGAGELREDQRVICRFGKVAGFLLQS